MPRIPYDEFAYFAENAAEFGLPYDGPPAVRRESVEVAPGTRLSALVWGTGAPEIVLLHGGAQNAHTWDTVALALGRPLVAIDLPGHGHSDGGALAGGGDAGRLATEFLATEVAGAIEALAPEARGVVGMSLGGLTTVSLTQVAPALVRRVVLVDIVPTFDAPGVGAIQAFIHGPESFDSFEDILARTIEHNPTRSEASLRRGILHNALQRDDGTWVWRYARHRQGGLQAESNLTPDADGRIAALWEAVSAIAVPLMLVRGMAAGSAVNDDGEKELLSRQPTARVEHVDGAGHSVQGDRPVELAGLIHSF
ncbi:MAG TPA: alpha/beta hydrolase, partial [Acidimicrobiia bacterium]|nr:alpha/beta hydrolase [Acidimicrobiia bacterium]